MKKNFKRTLAAAMVAVLTVTMLGVPFGTDAAKKEKIKLSDANVTVMKGKTKKVTIKNVKKNQVKKLKIKVNKKGKDIVSVTKSGKIALEVKGRKAGRAEVTVSVTLRGKKKATTLELKVNVKEVKASNGETKSGKKKPTQDEDDANTGSGGTTPIQTPGGMTPQTQIPDSGEATPTPKPVETTPTQDPGEVTPTQKPVETTQDPVEVTPTQKPVETTPTPKPVEVTPTQKPVETTQTPKPGTPTQKPMETTQKPGEATPTPKPGETTQTPKPGTPTQKPVETTQKPGEATPTPKPGETTQTPEPGEATPTPKPVTPNPWAGYTPVPHDQKAKDMILKYTDDVKSNEVPYGGKLQDAGQIAFRDAAEGWTLGEGDTFDIMKYDRIVIKLNAKDRAVMGEDYRGEQYSGKVGLSSTNGDVFSVYYDGFCAWYETDGMTKGRLVFLNDIDGMTEELGEKSPRPNSYKTEEYPDGYLIEYKIPDDISKTNWWSPEDVSKYCDCINFQLADGNGYNNFYVEEIQLLTDKEVTETPEPTEPGPTPLVSYKEDFESYAENEKDPGDWYARGNDGCEFKVTEEEGHNNSWKAGLMTRPNDGEFHAWNGPAMDLTKILTPGATYKVSFWAKVPDSEENEINKSMLEIMLSSAQYITEQDQKEGNSHNENYPRDTWTTINADDWTKVETTITVPDYCYEFIMYIETTDHRLQFGRSSFLIDDFEIEMISKPEPFDVTLQSIQKAYGAIGNGLTMGVAIRYDQLLNDNTFGFIKHHYTSLSTEDEMTLDEMLGLKEVGSRKVPLSFKDKDEAAAAGYVLDDDYVDCEDNKDEFGNVLVPEIKFSKVDRILDIAKENNMKVRLHSPFWHTQMPQFFFTKDYQHHDDMPWSVDSMKNQLKDRFTDKETMHTRMRMYVYTLLKHVKDKGYEDTVSAYDVVNEYLNSGGPFVDANFKYANYWAGIFDAKVTTDSEYVKSAFKSANDALVEYGMRDKIKLMYNDYSTYSNADRIIEMINNVNADAPDGQKYCDGVGMQSHVGTGNPTPQKFGETIKAFSDAGFEVQITELDMGSTAIEGETPEQIAESTMLSQQDQADAMGRLMTEVIKQKKAGANITSITLWGVCDAASWATASSPLLFGSSVSDKKPSFDAFVQAAMGTSVAPSASRPPVTPTRPPTTPPTPTTPTTSTAPTRTPRPTKTPKPVTPNPWAGYTPVPHDQKAKDMILKYTDDVKSDKVPYGGKLENVGRIAFRDAKEGYTLGWDEEFDILKYDRIVIKLNAKDRAVMGEDYRGELYSGKVGLSSTDWDVFSAHNDGFCVQYEADGMTRGRLVFLNCIDGTTEVLGGKFPRPNSYKTEEYPGGYLIEYKIPDDISKTNWWSPEDVSKYCDCISFQLADRSGYDNFYVEEIQLLTDKEVTETPEPTEPGPTPLVSYKEDFEGFQDTR